MTNPYSPPSSELTKQTKLAVRSRIGWFLAPAIVGGFIGNQMLRDIVGMSIGDPSGASRASAIGGFIGLGIGAIAYVLTRRKHQQR